MEQVSADTCKKIVRSIIRDARLLQDITEGKDQPALTETVLQPDTLREEEDGGGEGLKEHKLKKKRKYGTQ